MNFTSLNYADSRCVDKASGRRFVTSPDKPAATAKSIFIQEIIMAWTTPAATDLRFGFEITMYIANR